MVFDDIRQVIASDMHSANLVPTGVSETPVEPSEVYAFGSKTRAIDRCSKLDLIYSKRSSRTA